VSAGAGLKLGAGGGMLARLVGGSGGARARDYHTMEQAAEQDQSLVMAGLSTANSQQRDFDR
jgi:hypothetical protein